MKPATNDMTHDQCGYFTEYRGYYTFLHIEKNMEMLLIVGLHIWSSGTVRATYDFEAGYVTSNVRSRQTSAHSGTENTIPLNR